MTAPRKSTACNVPPLDVPRIVVVGAGFAGYHAAKKLCRLMGGDSEIVVVNPTDYFLYLPLLPEVSAGLLDPRRITVSIPSRLPKVRLVLGTVDRIDVDGHAITYVDPEGREMRLEYDRLLLTSGSVNRLLPIPGVAQHAHGFRNIAEALYLRDHVTMQVELADSTDDPAERAARLTFVVVGAGYTGTEVAAQGSLMTRELLERHPRLRHDEVRWLLVDTADRLLPGLAEGLGTTAERVLRKRGVEVMLKSSVSEATATGVTMQDGTTVPTRTLVWCVGVLPEPVVSHMGLPTVQGRLCVDAALKVPDVADVYACGDVAAVPDLTRPGEITPMTAQHAQRQGVVAAKNIAASLGRGTAQPYKHRDLGFIVDLGGAQAAANPLKVQLSGLPAMAVARAYHLYSLPANRVSTATSWAMHTVWSRPGAQLGLVKASDVPLETTAPNPSGD